MAHARHGLKELFQSHRVGVQGYERIGTAVFSFVLGKPAAQRRRELTPERIEPVVGHFEDAAHVRWLTLVEEEFSRRRVIVTPVTAFEKFQRHQRVEEIACRSWMEPQPLLQSFDIPGVFRKLREQPHFNGAQ